MHQPLKYLNSQKLFGIYWFCLFAIFYSLNSFFSISPTLAQQNNRIVLNWKFDPDPLVLKGNTQGSFIASEVVKQEETATGSCVGFIDRQPNHILRLNSFFEFLKLEVQSKVDTTIVVEGPGGIWCNDDTQSKNPAIEGQWQAGVYKVWVGSYQKNTADRYIIKVTQKK